MNVTILFCLFCSVLFCSVLFCSVLFCSVPFHSIPFHSVLFSFWMKWCAQAFWTSLCMTQSPARPHSLLRLHHQCGAGHCQGEDAHSRGRAPAPRHPENEPLQGGDPELEIHWGSLFVVDVRVVASSRQSCGDCCVSLRSGYGYSTTKIFSNLNLIFYRVAYPGNNLFMI